jgi:hypothetical protein
MTTITQILMDAEFTHPRIQIPLHPGLLRNAGTGATVSVSTGRGRAHITAVLPSGCKTVCILGDPSPVIVRARLVSSWSQAAPMGSVGVTGFY